MPYPASRAGSGSRPPASARLWRRQVRQPCRGQGRSRRISPRAPSCRTHARTAVRPARRARCPVTRRGGHPVCRAHNEVSVREEGPDVVGVFDHVQGQGDDRRVGAQCGEFLGEGGDFVLADVPAGAGVPDEVVPVEPVGHEGEMADAVAGECVRGGRADAPGSDQHDPRVLQLLYGPVVLELADPEDVGSHRHGDRLGAFTGDVPGNEIRQIVFGIGVLQARGMGDGPVTRTSGRLVAVGYGCPESVELHEHAASGTHGEPGQVEVRMDAAPPASGNGRIAAEQALLGRRFHREECLRRVRRDPAHQRSVRDG
ncbi:hypothetical protein SALBM311S_02527 [Streptomyces alboniger]